MLLATGGGSEVMAFASMGICAAVNRENGDFA